MHFVPRTREELKSFWRLSVTAGVTEEIIFRGFLIWYLLHFMPLWLAVVISSLVFGLCHSYQGLGGGIKTGLVGLAFALLYVLTGSIWVPIFGHIAWDMLQGQLIFDLQQMKQKDQEEGSDARDT